MGVRCHAPRGGLTSLMKTIVKILLIISYSMLKEFKKIPNFIFCQKMGGGPATPLEIDENNSENFIDHKLLDAEGILKNTKY